MAQFLQQSTCRTGPAPATAERETTEAARTNTIGEDLHIMLGAYVLGALTNRDDRAFRDHLRACAPCRRELDELAGITRLLDLLDPTVLTKPA